LELVELAGAKMNGGTGAAATAIPAEDFADCRRDWFFENAGGLSVGATTRRCAVKQRSRDTRIG